MSERETILRYFGSAAWEERDDLVQRAACHLVAIILDQHRLRDARALASFCRRQRNLAPWLPSESDRAAVSERILHGLRRISS